MSVPSRGQFEGVRNIVRFNAPFFVAAVAMISGSILGAAVLPLPPWTRRLLAAGGVGAAWWLALSLAASHWIYDRSPLYHWSWLRAHFGAAPRRLVNVHAGFDESSAGIAAIFPQAELEVFDFYDPVQSPEPSIERARRSQSPAIPARKIAAGAWPRESGSADGVMLILAGHELRQRADRDALFAEVGRVLTPGGRLVLVEHLRDWANFAAFGPGFLHFFSGREWRRAVAAGGLRIIAERSITPFVHVFIAEPAC